METSAAINAETLNVVQQALRGLGLSIAAAARADLVQCATLLQTHATGVPDLHPLARAMLLDLAEGFDTLGRADRGRTDDA